ncbi:MAG: SMP-30/gluconolactonase/LRE family protein [Betaproteobacteria bacterium]
MPVERAVAEPALLGESPFWHPHEQRLYYCDIAGRELRVFDPADGRLARHAFASDVASAAPVEGGGVLLARRDGLWFFDPATGAERQLAVPPYDPAHERFNDGKCDPAGRFWCGTLREPRVPQAALYCLDGGRLERKADGITVSNGLGWSPDARTMYWADTKAHTLYALDYDRSSGAIAQRRVFARFAERAPGAPLERYGGRPDGAAVDADGNVWLAMYEGARLVQLASDGTPRSEVALPVRCPTMPCFGGADLRTLYVTTARQHRPADELAHEPWAGCVLALRVDVPGLPVAFARLAA